ncbi:eukaryotic translation initiation factor 3 subunit G-domain-containing protein [Pisolithus croceorrhizus]|nr:eukaryotic translation initiation factor 3 subunit G-domain-containing protein [Pisolithus croceorrhizus]
MRNMIPGGKVDSQVEQRQKRGLKLECDVIATSSREAIDSVTFGICRLTDSMQKTSWADDVDELDQPSKVEDYVDESGIRVTVELAINDEGKKLTRKTKCTLQKLVVKHAVVEREKWPKFGQERGNKEGPDHSTTTVGENVTLKSSAGNKSSQPKPSAEQTLKAELAKAGGGKVTHRLCKGDHFTAKCPYKDHPGGNGTGSYGSGANGPGASHDELPTLRVSNISEETQENDLRELFGAFGRVVRVYVGRDRETGIGEVFHSAHKAIEKLNGKGYDSLIPSVQWSHDHLPHSGKAWPVFIGACYIILRPILIPWILIPTASFPERVNYHQTIPTMCFGFRRRICAGQYCLGAICAV